MKKSIALTITILYIFLYLNAQTPMVELLPNQNYIASFYWQVNRTQAGTLEQVTYNLQDSARLTWMQGFSPKTIKSTWCLDPTRVDYRLKSPVVAGTYLATFRVDATQPRNGVVFDDYGFLLTVTTKPTPTDTILIEARVNELKSVVKTIKASLTLVQTHPLCRGYLYEIVPANGLQQHKVFLRDSTAAWVKLNRDTFSLRKNDSFDLKLNFISPTIGQYETYLVTNREHRGFPLYTLVRFTVKAGTPVNDLTELGISVFPNPTTNKVQITSKKGHFTEGVFELTNLFGQVVKRQIMVNFTNTSVNIDVSDLQKGVYLLRFSDAKGGHFATKIVKND